MSGKDAFIKAMKSDYVGDLPATTSEHAWAMSVDKWGRVYLAHPEHPVMVLEDGELKILEV